MILKQQGAIGFDRIKLVIACLLLAVYGLGLDFFINAVPGFTGITPKYIWVLMFIATFPLLLVMTKMKQQFQSPLIYWLVLYNLISIAGITYSIDYETTYQAFIGLCATNLIMLPAWLSAGIANQLPTKFILSVFLLACLSVIADFFFPFRDFGIATQGIVDRASGVYLNPNLAGVAIVALEALLILRSPRAYLMPIIFIGLIATVLTFSRGAFFLQALMLLGLIWSGDLPKEFRVASVVIFLAVPFIGLLNALIVEYLDLNDANVLSRLAFMTGQDSVDSVTVDDRYYLLISAFDAFLEKPFFGGGLGYFLYWDEIGSGLGSTHNMTLRYMLDFGIIGFFIWGAFCLAQFIECRKLATFRLAAVIGSIALFASFFSHNLAEQGMFLVPLYFAAKVGSRTSVRVQK